MVRMGARDVQSESDVQGSQRPLPGLYHVVVKDALAEWKVDADNGGKTWEECEEDNAERLNILFEVLAGTTPGQEGREIRERFYVSEKAMPRLTRLALATGLLLPGEGEKEVVFAESVGRQCVVELVPNKYKDRDGNDKETVQVAFLGIWSLVNPEVKDVPKDEAAIRGEGAGEKKQAAGAPSAAATEAASSAVATTGTDDAGQDEDWSDL